MARNIRCLNCERHLKPHMLNAQKLCALCAPSFEKTMKNHPSTYIGATRRFDIYARMKRQKRWLKAREEAGR